MRAVLISVSDEHTIIQRFISTSTTAWQHLQNVCDQFVFKIPFAAWQKERLQYSAKHFKMVDLIIFLVNLSAVNRCQIANSELQKKPVTAASARISQKQTGDSSSARTLAQWRSVSLDTKCYILAVEERALWVDETFLRALIGVIQWTIATWRAVHWCKL